jgi:hypothetical protein
MLANFIVDNPPEQVNTDNKKLSRRAMKRAQEQG